MSTIYVENYRDPCNTNETDDQVIQRAVYALEDGDTLLFDRNVTYVLKNPVYFTMHQDDCGNITSKCRMSLTIEGNGCKISNDKKSNGFSTCNKLFVLSDTRTDEVLDDKIEPGDYYYFTASGLMNCTIRGFNFVGQGFNEGIDMCAMGPIEAIPGSMYIKNCTIENCTFRLFKTCLYVGGGYNTVKNCHFSLCNIGINADCTNYSSYYSNYFYSSSKYAIILTQPYECNVYNNTFVRCKGNNICANGTLDRQNDEKIISVNIYSNVLKGILKEDDAGNQNGIYVDGIKSAIIRDNIIRDMRYAEANPTDGTTWGHGIRIDGLYNLNTPDGDNKRFCEKIITTGNQIFDCMHSGIRTNYSQDCVFSNNSIYSRTGDKAVTGDYGILIGKNTSRNVFSNNNLYDYDDNNDIVNYAFGITELINNNSLSSSYSNDLVSPTRYISNTGISENDSSVLVIPAQLTELANGDEFYLYIPEGYKVTNAIQWSYISYNGTSGIVYDSDGETKIPESYYGKYIKLRYNVRQSTYSTSYRYTIVE